METIEKAIVILRKGGIVIFPTDTAYGIGCRIDSQEAVERLFKVRKRPHTQAVPVLVDSIEMAQNYLFPVSDNVRRIMKKYWPGALTIVYPCLADMVPVLVRGNGKTLGVRMPQSKVILTLIKGVGVPILGPSANFHGQSTPYAYDQLDGKLIKLVDYVIKGPCQLGKISTVIDCSTIPWRKIRAGAVAIDNKLLTGEMKKKKTSVILLINTSDNRQVIVELAMNGRKTSIRIAADTWTSQTLLPVIDELRKKNKISLSQITEIRVNTGPGSFTGLRVGIAVANALGWLLGVPVNGKKDKLVEPIYQ